ncbi:MAG: glutathione S-transferase family protein [Pseudoxanthomonas sp.]
MSLTLHYHPLSSFCHKVLVALYENEVPFTPRLVDLGDAAQREAFKALWPVGKFPVLEDQGRGKVVPESSIIIEYLEQHYPGRRKLIPEEPEQALEMHLLDRFVDLYVHEPMQKIVGDRLRPEGAKDPHGVDHARRTMRTALGLLEKDMASRTWATGDTFGLADCAAAPALFYADKVMPIANDWPNMKAYLDRLMQRPSYARVLREAEPYFSMFPG